MQERTAAARRDLLHALTVLVPLVEVQIAREEHARLALEYFFLEEPRARLLFVARVARIRVFEDPARLGHAEDELRTLVHAPGDLLEILHLGLVEIGAKLQIDGEQPPVRREPEREVAARLARGAPRESAFRPAERAGEGDQAVVPVVVARDGIDVGMRAARERHLVRSLRADFVLVARGIGIDLVAAEHQHAARARGLFRSREIEREFRPRDGIGDREGRIPAVADVGDVVEPEIAFGVRGRVVEIRLRLARERLDEAGVGVAPEDVGDGNLVSGVREHTRVVPAHHRAPSRTILLRHD